MSRRLTYLLLMLCIMLASCKRRPLYDGYGGNLFLEIEIQTEVETDVEEEEAPRPIPTGMCVNFFNLVTHNTHMSAIVSPSGGYISITPDRYDLLVYNYDTEYIVLRNESNFLQAEAYTNEAPGQVRRAYDNLMKAMAAARGESSRDYAGEPLINQPDHLYVGMLEEVNIPLAERENEVIRIHVVASTIAHTYKLIARGISGMQYISSAAAYVSGQASSVYLHNREAVGGPASLYVPLGSKSETELNAIFTTFGKYDKGDGKVWVILRLADLDGKVYSWEFDVTDQVDSGSHVIVVEGDLHIEPTTGTSGFNPEVDDWGEIITHIDM